MIHDGWGASVYINARFDVVLHAVGVAFQSNENLIVESVDYLQCSVTKVIIM